MFLVVVKFFECASLSIYSIRYTISYYAVKWKAPATLGLLTNKQFCGGKQSWLQNDNYYEGILLLSQSIILAIIWIVCKSEFICNLFLITAKKEQLLQIYFSALFIVRIELSVCPHI